MKESGARERQCVLFDWGDTVMRVFPEFTGPMESWPRVEAVEGIREAIWEIRRHSLVCLATNAVDSGESAIRRALARAGLEQLFDRVFCFESIGFRKPSASFYQTAAGLLELEVDKVFMVGDDFQADIQGATAVGIRSVWFNPISAEERNGTFYTTIHSLTQLGEAISHLGFRRS